jgi:hypothetical protein
MSYLWKVKNRCGTFCSSPRSTHLAILPPRPTLSRMALAALDLLSPHPFTRGRSNEF